MPLKPLKNKKIRLLSSLTRTTFLVFALSSCSLWESLSQKNNLRSTSLQSIEDCISSSRNSSSPFIVSQIEPWGDSAISLEPEEGLNNKFTLNLKAHLTDVLDPDHTIQNASFEIEYYPSAQARKNKDPATKSVTSDSNGYIHWNETYDYRYKMKPSWIVLGRIIKGGQKNARYYEGGECIPLAVNPWLSEKDRSPRGEPQILDIRREYSGNDDRKKDFIREDGLDYLEETKLEERPLLFVKRPKFQIIEKTLNSNEKLVQEYEELKDSKRQQVENLKELGLDKLLTLTIGELEAKEDTIKKELENLEVIELRTAILEQAEDLKSTEEFIQELKKLIASRNLNSEELKSAEKQLSQILRDWDLKHLLELDKLKSERENLIDLNQWMIKAVAIIEYQKAVTIYKVAKQKEQEALNELLVRLQKTCKKPDQTNCYKRVFTMSLDFSLEYKYFDRSGETEEILEGGGYDVVSQLLIASSKKDEDENPPHYRLHEENACQKNDIKISSGEIRFNCQFNMTHFDTNDSNVLFLKVTPHKNQPPFVSFQGVYTLKDINFNNVHNDLVLDLNLNGKLIDDEYYAKIYDNPEGELDMGDDLNIKSLSEAITENEEEGKNTPHPFGVTDPQELQLDGFGDYKLSHIVGGNCHQRENVVTRTVSFIGKICLKDHLKSRTLSETSFRVFVEKGNQDDKENYSLEEHFFSKREIFQTDADACISLPITLKHKIYDRQKYYNVKVHAYSKPHNLYGQVDLALSPWQRAFQAFQDAQNIPPESIRYSTEGISKPQLIINQFRSINLFPSYGLDKLLNIHLFHRVYFLFQPFIRRPDNLAYGLQHGSRELLRDGYYLVRVLLLRNPQETGNIPRVDSTEKWEENQSQPHQGDETHINLDGMEYITHTDSVAKAEANFINFYMPLYISTSQFLYIASRNLIVVEIYPADPDGFVYKDKDCSVDIEKTNWKKFDNHELINGPYVGVMNLQNWVNWNLLQPATGNTDKIIDNYPGAKKYRHFTFHSSEGENLEVSQQTKVIKLSGEMPHNEFQNFGSDEEHEDWSKESKARNLHIKTEDERQKEFVQKHSEEGQTALEGLYAISEALIEENSQESEKPDSVRSLDLNNKTEESLKQKGTFDGQHPALEEYGQAVAENVENFDILENFAEENSLKIINFANPEEEKLNTDFMTDMGQAFKELKNFLRESSSSFFGRSKRTYLSRLADLFPEETESIDLALFREQFSHFCPRAHNNLAQSKKVEESRDCEKNILTAYITIVIRLSKKFDPLFHFFDEAVKEGWIETDFWSNRPSECEKFQSYFSCYQYAQDTIFEIMNQAFNRSLKNRYFLQEILLHLLSSKGKEQLLHTFQSDCSRRVFQTSLQFETCYYNKILDLLNDSDYYQYSNNTLSVITITKQHVQSSDLERNFQYKMRTLLSEPEWDDVLKEVLELSQFFENKENLYQLIDEGIKTSRQSTEEVVAFTKSLCLFWMDSYIKKYLGLEQKLQAYTNYVKKFDYLQMSEDDVRPQAEEAEQVTSFWEDLPQFLFVALNDKKEDNLFSVLGDETGDSVNCYEDYAQCMIADYCLDSPYIEQETSKSEYCKQFKSDGELKDLTCPVLIEEKCAQNDELIEEKCAQNDELIDEKCAQNNELNICKEDNPEGASCNSKAKKYCEVNRDQKFCDKYNNRCYSGYLSCIESNKNSDLFNVEGALNYDPENKKAFAPLQTCLRNPLEFFKFENKMMVYDISQEEDPQYEGGFLRNFFVSANHSIGSYMNWTAQRGVGISSGAKVSTSFGASIPGVNWAGKVWHFLRLAFNGELSLGVSQSVNSNTSKSGRRAIDERVGEGLFLTVGQAAISLKVTKFQNCLVVKPRPNAFTAEFDENSLPIPYDDVWSQEAQYNSFKKVMLSRPGLIICNPIKEDQPETITEYYYYVAHQVQAENSQFLNLYDLANRPFVMILRGSKEFAKLYYMLRGGLDGTQKELEEGFQKTVEKERKYAGKLHVVPPSMFENYTWPIEDSVGLALNIREFNETGFHPGVYHYPYNENPLTAPRTQETSNRALEFFENNYVFFPKVPNSPNRRIGVEGAR